MHSTKLSSRSRNSNSVYMEAKRLLIPYLSEWRTSREVVSFLLARIQFERLHRAAMGRAPHAHLKSDLAIARESCHQIFCGFKNAVSLERRGAWPRMEYRILKGD